MMRESGLFLTARENKTSHSRHRHRLVKSKQNQTLQLTNQIEDRPFTSSLGRTQPLYNYRHINEAEEELTKTFRQDLSNYVRVKYKSLISKHRQTIVAEKNLGNNSYLTINSEQGTKKMRNKPRNIQLMKVCGMGLSSPVKIQKVLGQPYLVNTKERLARILTRKKQVEKQFQDSKIQKMRLRKEKDKSFQNPEHVTSIGWDSDWKKGTQKQVNRYRTRLENRHRKAASSMTIQW